jgi:hypothetical protein
LRKRIHQNLYAVAHIRLANSGKDFLMSISSVKAPPVAPLPPIQVKVPDPKADQDDSRTVSPPPPPPLPPGQGSRVNIIA